VSLFAGANGGYIANGKINEVGDNVAVSVEESDYMKADTYFGLQVEGSNFKTNWYARAYADVNIIGDTPSYKITGDGMEAMGNIEGAAPQGTAFAFAGGLERFFSSSFGLSLDVNLTSGSQFGYGFSFGGKFKF
jgi:hypothetical protein